MTKTDRRNKFEENVFSYKHTKDGKAFIYWHNKQIMILKGKQAEKFLQKVEHADRRQAQLIMAKITGHFKHGNKR